MNPKVDFYFDKPGKWQKEIQQLRAIVLDCGLTEQLKWGVPCYTLPSPLTGGSAKERNIVLIHTFKEYCALLFFKGALLNDADALLIQQTENVQAGRQIRFTGLQEINSLKATLKAYIFEAIEVEKAGLKVEYIKNTALVLPEEFVKRLEKDPALKTSFAKLTPGRQRAYNLYFTAPKQAKTREARIEKCVAQILEGKGLED
ncbi:hypothetical protein EXU57_02200 [Segetibacter sp. 3557_3]|uniref:YdeI/OmpD-associated family protein n=1 Tax=Segetibacter sp. 3557_3 TaxID=2547429 RepID=UPI0010586105|nr:DUF1801 domain-containing protein [Segetibacter sp. 3557_3]TDH28906.1 hypothetical protein EXU57_02200 [Segetibacter sp. 3557_3]